MQVIPYFATDKGGDVNVCANVASYLSRTHSVTIITTDYGLDEELSARIREDGVELRVFPCTFNIAEFLVSPSLGKWLRDRTRDYDVIHMHNYRSYQNVVTAASAKANRVPVIVQAHGSLTQGFGKRPLKMAFDSVWGRNMLRSSHAVIALTRTEAQAYREMGIEPERIAMIPNGIDLSKIDHLCHKGGFRGRHGIRPDEKILLYVGRLHESKGLELLISAFVRLLRRRNNLRLVIVGPDYGHRASLEKMARDLGAWERTVFAGFLSTEEKMLAYADSDIFITPTYYAFPITFLEAAACRLPIVTTTKGDDLDWISGKAGLVCEPTSESIESAIASILDNPPMGIEFGEMGRSIVERDYSWNAVVSKLEGLYSSVIDDGRDMSDLRYRDKN